jgi:hypothetical protein
MVDEFTRMTCELAFKNSTQKERNGPPVKEDNHAREIVVAAYYRNQSLNPGRSENYYHDTTARELGVTRGVVSRAEKAFRREFSVLGVGLAAQFLLGLGEELSRCDRGQSPTGVHCRKGDLRRNEHERRPTSSFSRRR